MIAEDFRALSLLDWLQNDVLLDINAFEPASSDASFRRYFRIHTPKTSLIAMDAPPDKENILPFLKVAELMATAGVKVPAIFQHNADEGFVLLEDFGKHSYLDTLNTDNANPLYHSAFDELFTLQSQLDTTTSGLPRYDHALLTRELGIFEEWFARQWLDIELPTELWQTTQNWLIDAALAQPVCCVHRDYHSRNLMALATHTPGIIDFQDAVIGPITYDLVSLLRDCYIAWPEAQVAEWRSAYHQRLVNAGLIETDANTFNRWFDLMGMQRHLKAIGIFTRLHLRDGKSGYLADIPRTLAYVSAVSKSYPELADFNNFLENDLLPAYRAAS